MDNSASIIPDKQVLRELSQKYDILLIGALNLNDGFDIEACSELEPFFKAMKSQGVTLLYCEYHYYCSEFFLIDVDDYSLDAYSPKVQQIIKDKVKSYNSELQNEYDFSKPFALYIRALLQNGKAIQLSIYDKWLEQDVDDDSEWIIPPADDAFKSEILNNINEHVSFISQKENDLKEKIIEADKIVFDYLINSPQYNLCTTKEARKHFAYEIISRDSVLKAHLDELGIERGYGYYLFIVEVVWKLKKQGKTEFDDMVASVMHYPLREIKRKF